MPRAPRSGSQQARTTQGPRRTQDTRRGLLRLEERLPLAAASSRFPTLGGRLLLVQEVEDGRDLGAAQCRAARALEGTVGEGPATQCRGGGLPVGQDHGRWG